MSALNKKPAARRSRGKEEHNYPVEPRTVVVVKKPRTIMNHSYRDFSMVPAELDFVLPTAIEEMTFSEKVHQILSKDRQDYADCISWMPHGRAFKIHIPKLFEEQICGVYFGHTRYSSFLRLLNNYGFKHVTQGADRNCYYHECFLRGMPHLCKYMPRPKNARRLIPDPENEPNFYRISQLFPLPDEQKNHAAEGGLEHNQEHALQELTPQEEPVVDNFAAGLSAANLAAGLSASVGAGLSVPTGHVTMASNNEQMDMQRLLLEQQQQQQQQRMLDFSAASLAAAGSLPTATLPTTANTLGAPAGGNFELAFRRQHLMNQLQQQQSTTAALLETLKAAPSFLPGGRATTGGFGW